MVWVYFDFLNQFWLILYYKYVITDLVFGQKYLHYYSSNQIVFESKGKQNFLTAKGCPIIYHVFEEKKSVTWLTFFRDNV